VIERKLGSSTGERTKELLTFQVSEQILEDGDWLEWSRPVQFRFFQREDGQWDLMFREVKEQSK
jgi:hypothetical protein